MKAKPPEDYEKLFEEAFETDAQTTSLMISS